MSNTTNKNQPYVAPVPPQEAARQLFRNFNNAYSSEAREALAQEVAVGMVLSKPDQQKSVDVLVTPSGDVAICIETKNRRTMGGWQSLSPEFHTPDSLQGVLTPAEKPGFLKAFQDSAMPFLPAATTFLRVNLPPSG